MLERLWFSGIASLEKKTKKKNRFDEKDEKEFSWASSDPHSPLSLSSSSCSSFIALMTFSRARFF